MSDQPPIGPPPPEMVPELADRLVSNMLRQMTESGWDPRGVASGVCVSLVRHAAAVLIPPPDVASVRTILRALIPPLNQAAEQIFPPKPSKLL